ncbi:hypothetical protein ACLMJK_009435 [Lecanora helva]
MLSYSQSPKSDQNEGIPVSEWPTSRIRLWLLVKDIRQIEEEEIKEKSGSSLAVFWGTFFSGMRDFQGINDLSLDIFRFYMLNIAVFTEFGHKSGKSTIYTGKIAHTGSTYPFQVESLILTNRIHKCKLMLVAQEWYHMRYKEGRA